MKKNIAGYLNLFVFVCCTFVLKAQHSKIDSILIFLKTDKPDTLKVNHFNILCNEYALIGEYDNGLRYGKEAFNLGKKLNFKKGIAMSYINIGFIDANMGNYPEALKKNFISLKMFEEMGDKLRIANTNNGIGNIYDYQGNYPEALKKFLFSLKLYEQLEQKNGVAVAYNNIGNIVGSQGNTPEALKNYFAALNLYEELKDKRGTAYVYANIGSVYMTQKNHVFALKNHLASLKIAKELGDKQAVATAYINIGIIYMDQGSYTEALKNYFISLKLFDEIGDKFGVSSCQNNIGNIYTVQGKHQEALKNHYAALKIREENGDKAGIAMSYVNIGTSELGLGHAVLAKEYSEKALILSNETGNVEGIKESYLGMANADSALGNYRLAYANYKMFVICRDSINNEESKEKTIQSQMTYDFEKKENVTKAAQEKKDVIADKEKQKQKIITWSIVGGFLLVVIFAFFIFRSLNTTRKQKHIIEIKSKQTEAQKQIIEEKHKEITDSINYAERIQRSFLATKEILDENLSSHEGGLANGHFVLFQPKDVVSGDFYWAASTGSDTNKKFVLCTADSTGHGVPGAIMSLLNITSLEKAIEQYNQPSDILNATRKTIIERLKRDGSAEGGKDGMDCSLICFDFVNNKFTYSAANNPIWIIRKNELIELKPDKMPVGKHDKDSLPFAQHEFDLLKGDVVYTLTDGLPDQFGGPKGKKFMYKQLKELLISISSKPMETQKQILADSLNNWKGDLEQVDDVCVIGVRI